MLTSSTSVPVAAALQPRVLVSSDILVKAYACIASLARDLGQLQRTLNEKPYEFSLQAFKPGQPLVLLKHPVLDHDMFPVDPRFVDVSDACHTALTQLLYSSRLNEVLEMMEKGPCTVPIRPHRNQRPSTCFISAKAAGPPAHEPRSG